MAKLMFERTSTHPKQAQHIVAGSQGRPREDSPAPQEDPLALDPYSPTFPRRAPDPDDPLALDPYSPTFPVR